MQTTFTGYVTRPEWRWVTVVSVFFLVLAFVPLGAVAVGQVNSVQNWRFMGAVHQHQESTFALSLIRQGANGSWLAQLQHTPESHLGALIQPVYMLLGQVSRWIPNANIFVYHVARLFASLLMYLAIYQLGASIFTKVRARRIFFMIASVGSGLGWVIAITAGEALTPDVTMPHVFPFFASLVNVHFPLSIAGLAFMLAVLLTVLRVGEREFPSVQNGGLVVFVVAILLSFVQPEVMFPLMLAFMLAVGMSWWQAQTMTSRELNWLMWLIIPTLPIATYYALILTNNMAMGVWFAQRQTPILFPPLLVLGLGVPLFLALPGIFKSVQHFRTDSDRLMLIWLVVMVVLFFLPLPPHETFLTAGMLPIAYFATRALEDFWLKFVKRRWRLRLFVVFVPLIAMSNFFVAFVPVIPLVQGQFGVAGAVLEADYVVAFDWMQGRIGTNATVLAAPSVSKWIPAWVGSRVVSGHPVATLFPRQKDEFISQWYANDDPAACPSLLSPQPSGAGAFSVDFVLYGTYEQALGKAICLQDLQLLATFGRVGVYFCDVNCKLRAVIDRTQQR